MADPSSPEFRDAFDALQRFAAGLTTPPEHYLDDLARQTRDTQECPQMLTGAVEGRLLEFLVFLQQPKLVLEIGTYSGYSALSMARALPSDGRIITLELDPERAAFARRHTDRHGRISVRQGPALETIATLDGPFDLVFIDADKDGYVDYYEAVLPKLAPRGLIVADNTLGHERNEHLARFNEHVRDDPRTVQVLLTVRDGLTLIRRA
jgi:caffeoyl-CoA O-methyltransferase